MCVCVLRNRSRCTSTKIKQPNNKRRYMCIERNKKRKPLITLLSLDFFPFFFPTALLFFKFASFSSQEITTTSKSCSRTDTCDLLLLLLLIIIYFIFNSPRGPARPAVVVVPAPCSGLTFLSTYWCRSVLLCLLFLLFLLLPLLMLLFLFLLSSLALAQLASLFSVFLVHRAH